VGGREEMAFPRSILSGMTAIALLQLETQGRSSGMAGLNFAAAG